jgi:hypothetical protein
MWKKVVEAISDMSQENQGLKNQMLSMEKQGRERGL